MIVTCNEKYWEHMQSSMPEDAPCGRSYDDAERSTRCPHPLLGAGPVIYGERLTITGQPKQGCKSEMRHTPNFADLDFHFEPEVFPASIAGALAGNIVAVHPVPEFEITMPPGTILGEAAIGGALRINIGPVIDGEPALPEILFRVRSISTDGRACRGVIER